MMARSASHARRRGGRGAGPLPALALTAALLCLSVEPALASREQRTIFDASGDLARANAAERAVLFRRLEDLGIDMVRAQVRWREIAPQAVSEQRPDQFDASNPAQYPAGAFETVDQVVRWAHEAGVTVLLNPTHHAPRWASEDEEGVRYPDPVEFEQFVQALGRRYDGSCAGAGCGEDRLPRVSFWSFWNEANLRLFIKPQRIGRRLVSDDIYRALFWAGRRGLRRSGHGADRVLIGETAPSPGSDSTPPMEFVRELLCLNRDLERTRDCRPIRAAGWSHHPYDPFHAPYERGKVFVSIGTLGRLRRALRAAAAEGATEGVLPVHITEYGVESYPDPKFGVNLQRQAEYLAISEFLLWRRPWVRSYAQYLMADDPNPGHLLSFQSGLLFEGGSRKPAYDAFTTPLVARRSGRDTVQIWGHVRPARGYESVAVEYADPDGHIETERALTTGADGYFSFGAPFRRGREWRVVWMPDGGRVRAGPWIRAYRFG